MSTRTIPHSIDNLGRRYYDLLRSQKYVDCSFKVDQLHIKCHKLILSAASPVFEAMFYGPMSEKQCVEILDISPETFRLMIEYIYTNEINFEKESMENVIELYYSAEKYILTSLVTLCLDAIQSKLRFNNILAASDLAVYMDLQPLLEICIKFFNKCCLSGCQFTALLKENYYHVSKNCLKLIVKLSTSCPQLNIFVREWCDHECKSLDLSDIDNKLVYNDLQLTELMQEAQEVFSDAVQSRSKSYYMTCNYSERVYYKACHPFIVADTCSEFNVTLKSDRFISLLGLVISSRLIPKIKVDHICNQEYFESLGVEIYFEEQIIYQLKLIKHKTSYNCDLSILLDKNVILTPSLEYCVRIIWGKDAYGAEYPCSLQSNEVNGITFIDHENHNNFNYSGSILKGIKYFNVL